MTASDDQSTIWDEYMMAGKAAVKRKNYTSAEKSFALALQEAEKFGETDERLEKALYELACAINCQLRHSDAETVFKRALLAKERGGEPNSLELIPFLDGLAGVYFVRGSKDQAVALYQRCLAIQETALGRNHPDTILRLISMTSRRPDKLDNDQLAEFFDDLSKRTLAAWTELENFGPRDPELCERLMKIGEIYQYRHMYPEAESAYRRALEFKQDNFGADSTEVAEHLNVIAISYSIANNPLRAEEYHKRAIGMWQELDGPNSIGMVPSLNGLASIYKLQKRDSEVEAIYRRILEIKESALVSDYKNIQESYQQLADFYHAQQDYTAQNAAYQQALVLLEAAVGPNHEEVADLLVKSANHVPVSRCSEGEPLYKRALEIQEKALGPDHPKVADTLNYLGLCYSQQGKRAWSEPLYKRALAIRERRLGPSDPTTLINMWDLGQLYCEQRNELAAESILKRAVSILDEISQSGGTLPWPNAIIVHTLGKLYLNQGKYASAEPLFQRIVPRQENGIADKENTFQNLLMLATVYHRQRKYAEAEPIYQRALAAVQPNKTKNAALIALATKQYVELLRETNRHKEAVELVHD